MSQDEPAIQLRPVIVGGDIGSYATARAFHEAYGVNTVIISGTRIGPVAHSNIVDLRVEPKLEDEFLNVLKGVIAEAPNATHILLGSVDWWVTKLADHHQELHPAIVPYPPASTLAQITNKARFAELCEELEIPHPRTTIVTPQDALPHDLPCPMVVKPADPTSYRGVDMPNKNKVEYFNQPVELRGFLDRVKDAGYDGEFIVQEYIPGGDSSMAALNAFYGPDGSPHFLVFGQVLLEEHTPNGRGNSVGQITGSMPDHPVIRHAQKFLDHLGWVGFANFDLIFDGEKHLFLELNPRVGRSGYAVTAAGFNTAEYYVQTFHEKQLAPPEPHVAKDPHLFTVVPLRLLKKYAPRWADAITALKKAKSVTNPYYYGAEKNPRRWAYIAAAMMNQFRKFARHHPGPEQGTRLGQRGTRFPFL